MSDQERDLTSARDLMDQVCDVLGCAPEMAVKTARALTERLARTQEMCVGLTRSVEALSAALTTKSNADATKAEPLRGPLTEMEALKMFRERAQDRARFAGEQITDRHEAALGDVIRSYHDGIDPRLAEAQRRAAYREQAQHRQRLAWEKPELAITVERARPSWQTHDLVWPDGDRWPYQRAHGGKIDAAIREIGEDPTPPDPRSALHLGDPMAAVGEHAPWMDRFRERFGATLEFSDQRQPRRPYVKATITRGDVNDANVEIKKHVSGITEVTVLRPEDT
jgi:hypothetical protein